MLAAPAVDESSSMSPYREASPAVGLGPGDRAAGADHARPSASKNTRTGGPDDDEDDELRRLMPILAAVITIAVVFGQ